MSWMQEDFKFIKCSLCALVSHAANFIFFVPLNSSGRYKYSTYSTTTATAKTQAATLGPGSNSCWMVELGLNLCLPGVIALHCAIS